MEPRSVSLEGRSRIRLHLVDGSTMTVSRPVGETAGIRYEDHGSLAGPIPWARIQAIQEPRSKALTVGLLGAGVVGAAALGYGMAGLNEPCGISVSLEPCGFTTGGVMAATAAGAGVGFLLGAGIGHLLGPSWKTLHARLPESGGASRVVLHPADGLLGMALTLIPG